MSTQITSLKRVGWKLSVDDVEETKDGGIEFLAVVSGEDKDRDGDIIDQSSVAEQWDRSYSKNPVYLFMHSWLGTIGHATGYARDGANSVLKVKMNHGHSIPTIYQQAVNVDDLNSQIMQRSLRSSSVAFNGTRIQERGEESGRVKMDDWMETSLVIIPSFRSGQIIDTTIRSYMKMLHPNMDAKEADARLAHVYDFASHREEDTDGGINDLLQQIADASAQPVFGEDERAALVNIVNLFGEKNG